MIDFLHKKSNLSSRQYISLNNTNATHPCLHLYIFLTTITRNHKNDYYTRPTGLYYHPSGPPPATITVNN